MNQIKLKETDRHWTCGRAPGLKSKRSSFARGLELKGTDCIFACVCLTCVSVFAHVKRRHAGSPACYLAFAPLVSSQVWDAVWVLCAEPVSVNGQDEKALYISEQGVLPQSREVALDPLCVSSLKKPMSDSAQCRPKVIRLLLGFLGT